MTIAITEEQRRERVLKLFAEVVTCDRLIHETDQKIFGYRHRNPYPNKAMLRAALKQMLTDQTLVVKRRNECLERLEENQKLMKNPPIKIIHAPLTPLNNDEPTKDKLV